MNAQRSLRELAEEHGLKRETVKYRLSKGWDLERALTTPVEKRFDPVGKRYNRLLVLHRFDNSNTCICQCQCGKTCLVDINNLKAGKQKSCGCLNQENRHARVVDLTGQVFGQLKVLDRAEDAVSENGKHVIRFRCECLRCGKITYIRAGNLKTGNSQTCGCGRGHNNLIDIVGQEFEFCKVIERAPNAISPCGNQRTMYKCRCCCGKIYTDWSFTIRNGRSNCGCKRIHSKGEDETAAILDRYNIEYVRQYWFSDLKGEKNRPYYFDFAIFDDKQNLIGLIEYQGLQHYEECKFSIMDFGKHQREVTDIAKKKYCKDHNIPLFEIAYNEDTTSKCTQIIKMLRHDNTVPSEQEIA